MDPMGYYRCFDVYSWVRISALCTVVVMRVDKNLPAERYFRNSQRKRCAAGQTSATVDGKNPANQLRLVVSPIIYRVLAPSQVVQDFFPQRYYSLLLLCESTKLMWIYQLGIDKFVREPHAFLSPNGTQHAHKMTTSSNCKVFFLFFPIRWSENHP